MIHVEDDTKPFGTAVCGKTQGQMLRDGDVAVFRSVHEEEPTCPTCRAGSVEY